MLEKMDECQTLPVHVERVIPYCVEDSLTARYDPSEPLATNSTASESSSSPSQTENTGLSKML